MTVKELVQDILDMIYDEYPAKSLNQMLATLKEKENKAKADVLDKLVNKITKNIYSWNNQWHIVL